MTNPIALDLLKLAEHYLSALHGSVARHDNIGLNLSCGGCALRDEIRDVLPKLAAVPAAVSVPPPAPRAVWREAAVFVEAMNEACDSKRPCESCTTREDVADALRLVADVPVPPPAPRADAWLDAAAYLETLDPAEAALSGQYAWHNAAAHLRRKAGEDLFAATPCSPIVACEPGGEPCDTHERLLGHIDGDHELCGPECSGPCVAGEQQNETPEAEAQQQPIPCNASHLRVHHAPHGWEPQPGMEPIPCPGYPSP